MKHFLYLYKGEYFYEQPKKTRIKELRYVDPQKGEVAVCKRVYNFQYLLGLFVISALVYIYFFGLEQKVQAFSYKDTLYVMNGAIGLDMINGETNEYNVMINLSYQDTPLIETITLNTGDTVGSVTTRVALEPGSYMCKLYYTVDIGYQHITEVYDVLVIVE